MARLTAIAVAILPGCSYAAYTPPSRSMPLETAAAPAAARTDVQAEGNLVSAIMGFEVHSGALRLRHGVHDNVAVTAEGGVLHVAGGNAKSSDVTAYLGRVGAHVHPARQPRVAMTGGVGSGTSALAGRWATVDLGAVVSTETFHWVPFASFEGFFSAPIAPRPFEYSDTAGERQSDILSRTRGMRATVGLEWRPGAAGPESSTSLLAGLSYGAIADAGDSDEILGLGAALKVKLD